MDILIHYIIVFFQNDPIESGMDGHAVTAATRPGEHHAPAL